MSTVGRGGKRRRVSPLTLRILAVNVLALALLMAGLLYLGRYQDRLIQAETEALATEARIFASALGEGAVNRILTAPSPTGDESGERFELAPELARPMIRTVTAIGCFGFSFALISCATSATICSCVLPATTGRP